MDLHPLLFPNCLHHFHGSCLYKHILIGRKKGRKTAKQPVPHEIDRAFRFEKVPWISLLQMVGSLVNILTVSGVRNRLRARP
jgi:hypothetical protein